MTNPTIKIKGKERPVPVGCRAFEMQGGELAFKIHCELNASGFRFVKWPFLSDYDMCNAFCRAHAHFTKKADAISISWEHDCGHGFNAKISDKKRYNQAAAAWLELMTDKLKLPPGQYYECGDERISGFLAVKLGHHGNPYAVWVRVSGCVRAGTSALRGLRLGLMAWERGLNF